MGLRRLKQPAVDHDQFMRTVCKLMNDAPEWREWFAWQLDLLDLKFSDYWLITGWMTMERIRG